jgi:hypothetical protein
MIRDVRACIFTIWHHVTNQTDSSERRSTARPMSVAAALAQAEESLPPGAVFWWAVRLEQTVTGDRLVTSWTVAVDSKRPKL